MTLSELTNNLQSLCHEGHSLAKVECGTVKDGSTVFYEIDSVTVGLGGEIVLGLKEQKGDFPQKNLIKVMNALPKVEAGETKYIECPLCGAEHNHAKNMSVGRAKENGHLWVKCADCFFLVGA